MNTPRHYLIPILLLSILVSCTPPTSQLAKENQDPNVTPEGVRIAPDVVYGHKFGMALTFDMYQPKNPNGAGVIILDSGGYRSFFPNYYVETKDGLRLAIDEIGINNLESFLSKGMTVFVVRHGSSPKFKMREIVSDLRRAIRFIKFNANEYSVDAERIGLFGASSGGHLSLLLATTGDIGNPNSTEEFDFFDRIGISIFYKEKNLQAIIRVPIEIINLNFIYGNNFQDELDYLNWTHFIFKNQDGQPVHDELDSIFTWKKKRDDIEWDKCLRCLSSNCQYLVLKPSLFRNDAR